MSQNEFIQIMISSRNSVLFDGEELSMIRKKLKKKIEDFDLFGKNIFKVWINEDEPTLSFNETIWGRCLNQSKKADIVICLDCGESGWIREKDSIGICHAELLSAVNTARSKVWSIKLNNITSEERTEKEKKADKKFQTFISEQELFSLPVDNSDKLNESIDMLMQDAVVSLMQQGVIEASRGKGNSGEALTWQNMNYDKRSEVIIRTLKESIDIEDIGFIDNKHAYLQFKNSQNSIEYINVVVHAIPDALSIASAKERVGQPFLDDFKNYKDIKSEFIYGPIHIIGCHQGVTVSQARKILGFPDATILKDSFGIYVADSIQKIQMVFLEKCEDSSSTSLRLQEFLSWLKRTKELKKFIKRAESRKKIIEVISIEN